MCKHSLSLISWCAGQVWGLCVWWFVVCRSLSLIWRVARVVPPAGGSATAVAARPSSAAPPLVCVGETLRQVVGGDLVSWCRVRLCTRSRSRWESQGRVGGCRPAGVSWADMSSRPSGGGGHTGQGMHAAAAARQSPAIDGAGGWLHQLATTLVPPTCHHLAPTQPTPCGWHQPATTLWWNEPATTLPESRPWAAHERGQCSDFKGLSGLLDALNVSEEKVIGTSSTAERDIC